MFSRSEKYTVTGILTLLTVATTAGVGGRQEGIPAQATEPLSVAQESETPNRVFYRNGETKTIEPEADPTVTEWPTTTETDPSVVVPDPVPVIPDPIVEAPEPDPLPEEELLIQANTIHEAAPEVQTDASGPSIALVASAAVIGIIVFGAILFGIVRFLRRFRPTLSKEATAPPPIMADAPSLPRLETALGVKAEGNAV